MTINGRTYQNDVEARLLLVHYIRDVLGLTGTHIGCDTSQCGACTVLIDGEAVKSCTVFAVQASGANITTVEGLATDGQLHPVQEGFWEEHGLQCGFCTPGMLMTSVQLLERNPNPSEDEIRQYAREGRLREFRDGPRLMFKADQVEQLKGELDSGVETVDLGVSDSGGMIGLVDTTGASGTSITLSDADSGQSSGAGMRLDEASLSADLGLSGSLGGVPSPGRMSGGTGQSGTGLSGTASGSRGGINVFGAEDTASGQRVDPSEGKFELAYRDRAARAGEPGRAQVGQAITADQRRQRAQAGGGVVAVVRVEGRMDLVPVAVGQSRQHPAPAHGYELRYCAEQPQLRHRHRDPSAGSPGAKAGL